MEQLRQMFAHNYKKSLCVLHECLEITMSIFTLDAKHYWRRSHSPEIFYRNVVLNRKLRHFPDTGICTYESVLHMSSKIDSNNAESVMKTIHINSWISIFTIVWKLWFFSAIGNLNCIFHYFSWRKPYMVYTHTWYEWKLTH